MNNQDRRERGRQAFSLIELLVVIGVIGALSAISGGVILRARQVSRGMTCANNLRQIATGLLSYYTDYTYTPSFAQSTLPTLLANEISEPQVFVCPASPYPPRDSYSAYYVPREPTMATGFLLGCPNHTAENSTFGAFGAGLTLKGKTEPVLWNNQPVAPGTEVTGGTLTFADGTSVAINSGVNVVVLVSFEEGQGRVYSAVKIPAGSLGAIEVQAAHGTHFDVATPACTAGVRGTRFTVATSSTSDVYQTNVAVSEGTVWVDGVWPAPNTTALPAGTSQTFTAPIAQTPPIPIMAMGPTIGDGSVTWMVMNTSEQAFTVSQVLVSGPGNGTLSSITLNGNVIFSGVSQLSSAVGVTSGWQGGPASRIIGGGQVVLLTVQVSLPIAQTGYYLTVQ